MIEINGKVYRNIQEQVGENQENIEELDTRVTALEEASAPTVDAYTKAQTDALLLTKVDEVKEYEDTSYGINYGYENNTPQLFGSDDSGSHPTNARVKVTYDDISIMANSYNHGDDDDTYAGVLEVNQDQVLLEASDGTDSTTLKVSPSGVTVNGSPIGGGGSQLYAHSIIITCYINAGNNFSGLAYFISDDGTTITANNIVAKLIAAGYDESTKRIMFTGGVYLPGATIKTGTLNGLARATNSNTNLRVSYTSVDTESGAAGTSSFAVDLTSTDVSFNAIDKVIAL